MNGDDVVAGEWADGFDRRAIPASAHEDMWIASDGWAIRRIDWTGARRGSAPPRGSILFLPGRGDVYEKYLETLEHWHRRGWRVTATDWRGQGGSGRLGADMVTGHVRDFGLWIADLAAFWAEWVRVTPAPHVLIGHSMGGHLALRALVERRVAPVATVLSAPMLGFIANGLPTRVLQPVARVMSWLGDPRRAAWKWSEKPGALPDDRMNLLTSDMIRYQDEQWWRGQRPDIVTGAASWGWMEAALTSCRVIERRGALEAISSPVLVLTTDADGLVCARAIRRAAERLPNAEVVAFGAEARHELLREADPIRARALAAIDGFFDRAAPLVRPR